MNSRRRRSMVLVAATIAIACAAGCTSPPTGPDVVIVTLDTLRADHLGCYGYPRGTTPVLDELAGDAILFERAIAPMATTLPVHLSLFTATNPARHGVRANAEHLPAGAVRADGIRTLAEMLSDAGYETAAFVSAAPLKRVTGIDAGFAHFDEPAGPERRAWQTTEAVLEWLRGRSGRRPLFLWVHYFDPHSPYVPQAPWDRRFAPDAALAELVARRGVAEPTDVLLEIVGHYDGEVAALDDQLGVLFDGLREAGVWDGAALAVVGDHGEGLGEHGWMEHGRIYEEQLHVPLLLRPPGGVPGGRREPGLAAVIDVLPTLASLGGVPLAADDRVSFEGLDLLQGRQVRDWVYAERVSRERAEWEPGPRYALVGPRFKYMHSPAAGDVLYDLATDPTESIDVAAQHPDVAARMREVLTALAARAEREAAAHGPTDELPPEHIEALRSLGYVD